MKEYTNGLVGPLSDLLDITLLGKITELQVTEEKSEV